MTLIDFAILLLHENPHDRSTEGNMPLGDLLLFDRKSMTRSEAYKHILAMGLLALRDRAPQFNSSRLIEVEAEHLHNIPSLIDEDNLQRHLYYFNKERPAYIKGLKGLELPEYSDPVLRIYLMPWEVLLKNLGDDLPEGDSGKEEVERAVGGNGGQAR